MTPHAAVAETTGFVWFSERVKAAADLGGEEAEKALRQLIDDATADKLAGFGPPQDSVTAARRKWMAIYSELYRRTA